MELILLTFQKEIRIKKSIKFFIKSALRTFEASLENTRSAVLNSTRRLKLDEVDELAARLGEIGRETVELKGTEGGNIK